MTLPPSAANALMTRPETAAERLDFIARWRSGELSGDALIVEAERLLFPDKDSPYVDIESEDLGLDRSTYDAFLEAKDRIEAGEDADAVLAALMPSLIPGAYQDPAAAADLILDMLPIIGGIRAVHFAAKDVEEYQRAKAAGDEAAVRKAGISLLFAGVGVIPVAGPLLRNARAVFRNTLRNRNVGKFLRTAPGVKRIHAGFVFPRRFTDKVAEVIQADARTVFGAVYGSLTPRQQSLARGLISNIKGSAAHQELGLLAENARLILNQVRGSRTVRIRNSGKRIFDEFTERGYNLLFNTFLFPRRGRGGTLFEFKWGDARGSAAQQRKSILIEAVAENGELIETVASARQAAAAAEAIELARVSYKDVPEDWIADQTRRLFRDSPRRNEVGLTDKQIDQLVEAARHWHRQARHENLENISVGQMLMVLSAEAQALAQASDGNGETNGPLEA